MLWKLFDNRPWFAPKRFGYGAGWPIAWQGWALIASYLLALAGIRVLVERGGTGPQSAGLVLVVTLTALFAGIAWKRTRGGWHWRWGSE